MNERTQALQVAIRQASVYSPQVRIGDGPLIPSQVLAAEASNELRCLTYRIAVLEGDLKAARAEVSAGKDLMAEAEAKVAELEADNAHLTELLGEAQAETERAAELDERVAELERGLRSIQPEFSRFGDGSHLYRQRKLGEIHRTIDKLLGAEPYKPDGPVWTGATRRESAWLQQQALQLAASNAYERAARCAEQSVLRLSVQNEAVPCADDEPRAREAADIAARIRLLAPKRVEDAPSPTSGVLREVLVERVVQDGKWGAEHDDRHDVEDWQELVEEHMDRARRDYRIACDFGRARRQLVRVAALAVAAAESHDRMVEEDGRLVRAATAPEGEEAA